MNSVRRVPIGALQSSSRNFCLTAVIIGKSEFRKIVNKSDGTERMVCTLTLRDSPTDIINFTVWTESGKTDVISREHKIGSVVQLVNPRVMIRELGSTRDNYLPYSTSPFNLINIEGKTVMSGYAGDWTEFQSLLNFTTKTDTSYLRVMDVLDNKLLVGRHVDVCAGVRSVGPVKIFQTKFGEERKVRDVKLFDQTSQCIVLKIWDENLSEMCETWMPRETVVFLADVRVSFDDWRQCNTISSTGKTIISENPSTEMADSLRAHCQAMSFSSYTRLDRIVANLNPESITQVHNVISLHEESQKMVQDRDSLLLTHLYGYITKIDFDEEVVPAILRCGYCSLFYRLDQELGVYCCQNMDCREYRSTGQDRSVDQVINIKLDLADETGTLLACSLREEVIERVFNVSSNDMLALPESLRSDMKRRIYLCPLRLTLALLLPTLERRSSVLSVIHIQKTTFEEMCAKMPTPMFS